MSGLGFVAMLSLVRVHMRRGDMLKKVMTYHRSHGGTSRLVRQQARRVTSFLHIPVTFAQFVRQHMQNPMQVEQFKAKGLM
jgi:hypothetical protein